MIRKNLWLVGLVVVLLLMALAMVACQGSAGPAGPAGATGVPGPTGPAGQAGAVGPAGISSGTLSGTVTSSLTKGGVAGVAITTDPPVAGVTITTDATGKYTTNLPIGAYNLTFKKANYADVTQAASVAAGQTTTKNVTLVGSANVVVTAKPVTGAQAGATVSLQATVAALDGSTVQSYQWTQVSGAPATITGGTTATASVTLADLADYKAALFSNPMLTSLDRTMVQPINPGAAANAQTATFKLVVNTSSGSYSTTTTVAVALPFVVSSTGLQDEPIGLPVLVHGQTAASYSWSLAKPSGSNATLADANTQNPYFTPDVGGKYTLKEATTGGSLDVYAGSWVGALTGSDAGGQPLAANCTGCHNGKIAPDNFTSWKATGHAIVFTFNINSAGGHYGESCLACHSVGYNTLGAKNNGINNQPDFPALQASGLLSAPAPGNWSTILTKYPKTVAFTNIQCENCHGPNGTDTGLHPDGTIDPARVSLSADVCGACHGAPPHHNLFQQWQLSAHANFTTAISEGGNASCARCHTAQGFMAWLNQGDLTKSLQGKNGNATAAELTAMGLSPSTTQPITCAVCHDPHDEGNLDTATPTANVRIEGNTPMLPSGFAALNVGKGAICITCHNTRNGAHNDTVGNPASYSAPHRAAQGDVLMGENAYFVTTPARSAHANLEDTCATCHVELSPPAGGYTATTNHGFTASPDICGDCHGAFKNADNLQATTEAKLTTLGNALSAYVMNNLPAKVNLKDYTAHTVGGKSYDMASAGANVDKSNIVSVAPTEIHGQLSYTFTLKTAVTFTYSPAGASPHTQSLTTVNVQLGGITTDGTAAVFTLSDPLVKANWNYSLVESDSSLGVHNPSFVSDVLDASVKALH